MAILQKNEKVFGFVLPAGSSGELVKQTMISIMTVLFLLAILVLFVLPRFADLKTVSDKVSNLEMQSNNLKGTLEALDSFGQRVNNASRESIYLAIPTKFDPGYVLLSLRKLAIENRVSLITYSLSGNETETPNKKNAAIPHQVKVEISGSAENLIGFVDNLDSYLPIVSVSDLSISEISKVIISDSPDTKLAMSLNFYHMQLSKVPTESLMGKLLTQKDIETISSLSLYKRLGETGGAAGIPAGSGKENIFGF